MAEAAGVILSGSGRSGTIVRLLEAFASTESLVALLSADDGRFVDVNPAFERQTGYRREDVLGRIPMDVGLWSDLGFRAQLWESLRVERRVVDAVTELRCADGRLASGRLHVELMHDGERPLLFCLLQLLPDDHAERSGRRRESLYRDLFLHAAEGIYRSLPGGGFLDANPALARMLGYDSPAQLLLAHAGRARAIYVDQAADEHDNARLLQHDRLEQVRLQVYRRDGSRIWVSENCRVVRDDAGAPLFFEGSLEDITAQVEAEQALKQSQNLYRVLVENSRDGVFLIQDGIVRFANPAMAAMLDYPQAELIGKRYMDLIDAGDAELQASRKREREAGSRELQMYEIHMLRRDGGRILCEVRADAVDYDGGIASTGTIRDVTDERQQQRALVQAERRYRELFQDSPVGLFRSGLEGEIVEVNAAMASMLGFDSPESLKARYSNMLDVYAEPGERQLLVERALRDGAFAHHETRVRDASGNTRWVSTNVRLTRDENNAPAHLTGSALDVEERRAMQQALVSSETKYRTLVEQSHVGVFIMDRVEVVYANRALAGMLGHEEAALVGRPWLGLLAPEAAREASELHQHYFRTGEIPQDFESCLLHRDGQRVFVRVSIGLVEVDGRRHVTGTIIDITRQREAESRLRFHADHDPLTGLPNRAMFNRLLDERLHPALASRDGVAPYAVLYLDLDGFKWVNDSLGHGAGDRLLLEIARRLEDALSPGVLIARYGGDEFTLLPDAPCSGARAVEIAGRVLSLFEQPFDIGGQQVFSAASLGIVLGRPDYDSPDQLLRDADNAMYRAKAAGKSGFVVFDEGMHAEARVRLQLETDFRLALERAEFVLHYQPIVALDGGALVGAEALVRWQHPTRGLLLPGEFLPVAEETGLIVDLDGWVMREACRQLALWRHQRPGGRQLVMNVNVDERQMGSPELTEDVAHLLQTYRLPPDRVRLEVTESVFRTGSGHASEQLRALKALGVGLAVDDFGTGYSSLEAFAASPFDALKVDQSFVRDVTVNPRHRAIVRTIIGFAQDLGLLLTAEGIETEEQRQLLLELGCAFGQGNLFAPALPAGEFELRL
jgi:diguanylate cyclase (GGDEF)-like protein/PAS domain S-box-containing protein